MDLQVERAPGGGWRADVQVHVEDVGKGEVGGNVNRERRGGLAAR